MSNPNPLKSATPYLIFGAQNNRGLPDSISGKDVSVILSILVLLCFAVFHKFILGQAAYLFKDVGSDTLNVFYPNFINISEILWGGSFPGWSFEQGLGQNVFPFSLSDPAADLLYIIGVDNLSYGIIWMEIFKIVCGGLLFFCFLKKIGLGTNPAYIGSSLYAFSGFMIVGGSWYIFSTLGLYAALLLFSFELMYSERDWRLFPVSIALIAAYNFVSLYTCASFLLLYALFRITAEEGVKFEKIIPLFLRMLLLGVLGVLISAVFSIPNLFQMIDTSRVSGGASHTNTLAAIPMLELGNSHYLATILMRTFSSDLLGNGNNYKGWWNYLESPMSYCGLISLVLLPQVFVLFRTRKKIVYGLFAGIFIFAEIFPWFRRAFWLFYGDYFRDFSLFSSIAFIVISMLALDRIIKGEKVNHLVLAACVAILLAALYYPYNLILRGEQGNPIQWLEVIDHGVQARIAIFLGLISAGFVLFSFEKSRRFAPVFLLAITLVELAIFSYDSVNTRDVVTKADMQKKAGYNDHSIEAISFVKQFDKDFFRIEKNYGSSPAMHTSLNDSKVQHYFGSSSYHSFNQTNYINFLTICDVLSPRIRIEGETRWAPGVKNAPLLQILTGVRYLLFKGNFSSHPKLNEIYSILGNFDEVVVLKSKYALPLGVAYDAYMLQSDFIRLDTNRKHIALLKAIMVPDSMASALSEMTRISEADLSSGTYSAKELSADTDKLKASSLHLNYFANNGFEGGINARIKQLVFFSFPFDSGWKAQVNGKDAPILMVDGGLSAVLVEPGNNSISFRYFPPYVKEGLILTLLGLFAYAAAVFRQRRTVR